MLLLLGALTPQESDHRWTGRWYPHAYVISLGLELGIASGSDVHACMVSYFNTAKLLIRNTVVHNASQHGWLVRHTRPREVWPWPRAETSGDLDLDGERPAWRAHPWRCSQGWLMRHQVRCDPHPTAASDMARTRLAYRRD